MILFNEPRNWKWMVPFGFFNLFLAAGMWALYQWGMAATTKDEQKWTLILVIVFGFCFTFLVAALMNWYLYFANHAAEIRAKTAEADSLTPEVLMFQAARSMHPDAVHDLLAHRRMLWRIPYVAAGELVDWVLDDAPGVRAGFVDFVLDHSTGSSVMPKSMLRDKSKTFDPTGVVTDYEQYDGLILLMQNKLMCTKAYGNQSPKWIPPWTPALVRHRFGLEEGVYQAENNEGILRAVKQAEEWRQVHSPAANAEEAAWVDGSLKDLASRWDPNHPKSELASDLMSDEELSKIQKGNGRSGS